MGEKGALDGNVDEQEGGGRSSYTRRKKNHAQRNRGNLAWWRSWEREKYNPDSASQALPGAVTGDLNPQAPTVCQEPYWAVATQDFKC